MEALTTRMLALARGQQDQLAGPTETFDLAPRVEDIWRPFAPRAEARGLTVQLALAPAAVTADPVLLRSILANLFDNAVEYAPATALVGISLEHGPRGVALCVTNPAGELEPADVARLFDPFWRKEAARSGGQHFGLGLSLARTFATAMGWTLGATLNEQRRLVLRLTDRSGPA
jgi:two-component system sensor histidine kinase QseC